MTDPLPEIARLRARQGNNAWTGMVPLADAERAVRDADARARREERERLAVARLVADHWRKGQLAGGEALIPARAGAHPLCMVLAALDGETRPEHLGITPDSSEWDTLVALAEQGDPGDA